MNDELNQEPETISEDVSFLRRMRSKVSSLMRDPKKSLTGPARLVAEILARRATPILTKSFHDDFVQWQRDHDALQKTIDTHTDVEAFEAFEKQQSNLHQTATREDHSHSTVLSREDFERKFEYVRESANAAQRKLYQKYYLQARAITGLAAEILHDHAVGLDGSERARYETYGLPYTGSPLVTAVLNARKFILARVSQDEGQGGPNLYLPWLILD